MNKRKFDEKTAVFSILNLPTDYQQVKLKQQSIARQTSAIVMLLACKRAAFRSQKHSFEVAKGLL